MDPNLQKALLDRVYDKRKAATLELEKQARDALARNDRARISLFVQQLCALLTNNPSSAANPQSVNARNGGLIGLAGIGIALGVEIAAYLEQIVPPVLACFVDPDSKIRYFACESFYNIAKVCKGEILMYFNEIFDALSKVSDEACHSSTARLCAEIAVYTCITFTSWLPTQSSQSRTVLSF